MKSAPPPVPAAKDGRRRGIAVKAAAALAGALILILVALGIAKFLTSASARGRNQKAIAAVAEARAQMARDLQAIDSSGESGGGRRREVVQEFQARLAAAAQASDGKTAQFIRTTASILQQIQASTEKHDSILQRIDRESLRDDSLIKSKADLHYRAAAAQELAEASRSLAELLTNIRTRFREELPFSGDSLSEFEMDKAAGDFVRGMGAGQPLIIKICELDIEVARSMMGQLKLLDQEWGRWTADPDDGYAVFESKPAGAEFDRLVDAMNSAFDKQDELRGQMAGIQ